MEPKPIEIVMLALTDLYVPSWNPRPFMDEAPLQELMAFMKKGGIVPRIWVWKGNGQLASSSSELAHPNQGLRPEASAQGPRAVIAGQRRLEASRRLGRTQIEVEILDISLEDAMFLAVASNQDNKPYWLGEFIAVENLMAENKDLNQVDIKAKLGWSKKRVSFAVNLMKLLNPASRELIWDSARPKVSTGNFLGGENQDKPSPEDKWRLPEVVATRLIPLLDPLALEASQTQAEKALKMIVPRQLIGPQTDELVAYALSGKDLTAFKPADKVRKPRALARRLQAQGAASPSELAQTSQIPKPEIATSQTEPIGSAPRNDDQNSKHGGFKLVGHALGQAFHWAWNNPLHLLKSLLGWGKQEAMKTLEHSIKHSFQQAVNRLVKTAVLMVLLGVFGLFFFHGTLTHVIAWLMNVQPPTILNRRDAKGAEKNEANGVEITNPKPEVATSQTEPIGSAPRAGGQPQVGQPSAETASTNDSQKIKPPTRIQKDAQAALVFARHYFGANYQNIDSWKDFFKQAIDDEDYDPFMDNHFPYDKIHEITDKKLVMSFQPTQPVKLVDSDDSSDTFLVNGVMTTRTNKDDLSVLVSKKPIAAQIVFNRQSAGGYKVGYVKDLTPDEAQALLDSSPQADASASASNAKSSGSTKIDPLAKAVGDAAGEAAKKALNLPF
jgi:hypothetical protein